MFHMTEGRLPTEAEWPSFLFDGSPAHRDSYIDPDQFEGNECRDPWDRPYIYRRDQEGGFEIISFGADGKPGGTGDDRDMREGANPRQ